MAVEASFGDQRAQAVEVAGHAGMRVAVVDEVADQLVGFGDGLGPAADLDATRPPGVCAGQIVDDDGGPGARATSRYFLLRANSRPVTSMLSCRRFRLCLLG